MRVEDRLGETTIDGRPGQYEHKTRRIERSWTHALWVASTFAFASAARSSGPAAGASSMSMSPAAGADGARPSVAWTEASALEEEEAGVSQVGMREGKERER